jgi:hypothetical protein
MQSTATVRDRLQWRRKVFATEVAAEKQSTVASVWRQERLVLVGRQDAEAGRLFRLAAEGGVAHIGRGLATRHNQSYALAAANKARARLSDLIARLSPDDLAAARTETEQWQCRTNFCGRTD